MDGEGMSDYTIIKSKTQLMKLAIVDARRELDRLEMWADGIIKDAEEAEKHGKRTAEGQVV
jgi:hypothetical protein